MSVYGGAVSKRTRAVVSLVVTVIAVFTWNAFIRDDGGSSEDAAASSSTTAPAADTTTSTEARPTTTTEAVTSTTAELVPGTSAPGPPAAEAVSDLPTASVDDLPAEALDTLALIEDGGPYPYDQDDGTFGNREGLLPDQYDGYYREYTVETPGSPDRGARRLIVGADGEVYYTDNHYESFVEVVDAHL